MRAHGVAVFSFAFAACLITHTANAADECKPKKGSLIRGTINQGNYEFVYESWEGQGCRQYRLRNKPGKPLTPVKWAYGGVVFIDTNLPACKVGETCQPADKLDPSATTSPMKTAIGFGINKDQYVEEHSAVVESHLAIAPFISRPTWLAGTVADAKGAPVMVNLRFEPVEYTAEGKWVIRFKASQQQGTSTEPIEVSWGDDKEIYFVQRLEPNVASEWRFITATTDPTASGGRAILTMRQGGKTIAATTTSVPEEKHP